MLLWDMWMNILFTGSFIIMPMVIGSQFEILEGFWIAELVVDVFMFFDICLTFLKWVKEDIGFNKKFRTISWRYLTGNFVPDALACLPGLLTGEQIKWIYFLKLL